MIQDFIVIMEYKDRIYAYMAGNKRIDIHSFLRFSYLKLHEMLVYTYIDI